MKRIEPTIVEKATQTVDGFAKVYKMLQQQVLLRGQSKSTLENYIRRIALISLHFGASAMSAPQSGSASKNPRIARPTDQ